MLIHRYNFDGCKHAWDGARRQHSAPYLHVGGCEVVEQARVVMGVVGRHGDVEDSAGVVVGIEEGNGTDVRP